MATKLTIDGTEWWYDGRAYWRTERAGCWVSVALKHEGVVEELSAVYGVGEWLTAQLTDDYGWEWEYYGDTGIWAHHSGDGCVTLRSTDGVWLAERSHYGYVTKTLGCVAKMSLVDAIDALHAWIDGLWGDRVGELVWDEELNAYVGRFGRRRVVLYCTGNGWCAEIANKAGVNVIKSPYIDPRPLLTQLEAIYARNAGGVGGGKR